jgi:hypothetical protein
VNIHSGALVKDMFNISQLHGTARPPALVHRTSHLDLPSTISSLQHNVNSRSPTLQTRDKYLTAGMVRRVLRQECDSADETDAVRGN